MNKARSFFGILIILAALGSCSIVDFNEIKEIGGISNNEFITVPGQDFKSKLGWIKAKALHNTIYLIEIDRDETIDEYFYSNGLNSLSYDRSNVTVILHGVGGERTITADTAGKDYLFEVKDGVTLELENIALCGKGHKDYTVKLNGGNLTMQSQAKITSDPANKCGGVYVGANSNFSMAAGEISGNEAHDGGGVYVKGGTFTMGGTAKITNNSTISGGGVYVDGGTFTMDDEAVISGNTAANGGGVCVVSATFIMNGKAKIANNSTNGGGGGMIMIGSSVFRMIGGEISGNTAVNGGGMYIDGGVFKESIIFTMEGGEIFGNKADHGGGVNLAIGTFNMQGGKIFNNTADNIGGGVFVYMYGSFNMSGGEIFGNSTLEGGGVFVYPNGTFRISGGTVYGINASADKGNSAPTGAALYIDLPATVEYGTFSGETWVSSGSLNTTNYTLEITDGIVMRNTVTVTEGGLFEKLEWVKNNAQDNTVYIIEAGADESITEAFYTAGVNKLSYNDNKNITVVLRGTGGIPRTFTANSDGQDYLFEVNSGVTLMLETDITLCGEGNPLASGPNYTVVVNGGNLVMSTGSIITSDPANKCGGVYVGANSNFSMAAGEISGNEAHDGGGVYVKGGTFTMGGTAKIANNSTISGGGGGVLVEDTESCFTMNGGEICGNTANYSGGGVGLLSATFTMNGGAKIYGNKANVNGGGVYSSGIFTMNNGEISGNTAIEAGSGVFAETGTFRISNGTIYGSEAAEELKNTAPPIYWGAALFVLYGTAEYGTFSGATWNKLGDLNTSETTIMVVNGELQ